MADVAVTRWSEATAPAKDAIERAFRIEGVSPSWWSNGPGERYAAHSHGYLKVLYCARGSIVFRLDDGTEYELSPGDRLDIPAGTSHSALVGPEGVTCAEAARR